MSLTPEEIAYYQAHASDDRGPSLLASTAIGLFLAYTFVGLRIWARKAGKTGFGLDDWLIIAALAPLTAYGITAFIAVAYGQGKHTIFVNNVPGFIRCYVTAIVAYSICVVLTKLSILCFYCRIFFPIKSLYYISWGFGIFIAAYNIALIFVTAFECIPLSSLWTGEPATCIPTLPPFTALGIINVVTDVGILVLPIRFIIQLQLSVTRRIQVCGILLLGGVVCIFGIVRVVALSQAPKGDPSYNQVYSGVWSFSEISIGIVAACLPTLAVLATKSHLSKISASASHLLSITFRRSNGANSSGGSHAMSSTRSARKHRGDDSEYANLSEVTLPRGKSADSRNSMHNGGVEMSPFAGSSFTERGERREDRAPRTVVGHEIV